MQDLAADVVALMDHLSLPQSVIAGCSVGGMVAMATALAAASRVSALILSNSAARMGTPKASAARIDAITTAGLASILDMIFERWFPEPFRASPECLPWRSLLLHSDPSGHIATCRALALADLRDEVPRITCPVPMLAGSEDIGTPPALVQATATLIPNARDEVLAGAGHIPAIDAPAKVASLVTQFLPALP